MRHVEGAPWSSLLHHSTSFNAKLPGAQQFLNCQLLLLLLTAANRLHACFVSSV